MESEKQYAMFIHLSQLAGSIVVLNGDVFVGRKCFIGSCTVVNGQLKIGDSSIVGSGSVVIRNVDENVVVAGSPTRLIRKR